MHTHRQKVLCIKSMENTYTALVGQREGKIQLCRPRLRVCVCCHCVIRCNRKAPFPRAVLSSAARDVLVPMDYFHACAMLNPQRETTFPRSWQ
jgi:hypothetical protein